MGEHVFTIFEGPGAGRTFEVDDRPVTIGREEGRDVVLEDERVSRLHARIVSEEGRMLVTDEGSSNGTFVNGALVSEREIHEGDVIAVGRHRIVFGREAPKEAHAPGVSGPVIESAVYGTPTLILPDPPTPGEAETVAAGLNEIMAAAADAARSVAGERGIHISVEGDLVPDTVQVAPNRLYKGLAALLASLMNVLPRCEGTLALRSSEDPFLGGFRIDLIGIGIPVPQREIASLERKGAFVEALYTAIAHRGVFELMPKDSPDTFARLRLPSGSADSSKATVIQP